MKIVPVQNFDIFCSTLPLPIPLLIFVSAAPPPPQTDIFWEKGELEGPSNHKPTKAQQFARVPAQEAAKANPLGGQGQWRSARKGLWDSKEAGATVLRRTPVGPTGSHGFFKSCCEHDSVCSPLHTVAVGSAIRAATATASQPARAAVPQLVLLWCT